MDDQYLIVSSALGIGLCTAVGVGLSSQVLLGESLETTVDAGVQSGLLAALVFLLVDTARRRVAR